MNHLINQLMTVDKAFYRHYLEMLLTLNRIQALEIRFMKGWKLKELEKIMPAWQRRQCEEIKRERWRGF